MTTSVRALGFKLYFGKVGRTLQRERDPFLVSRVIANSAEPVSTFFVVLQQLVDKLFFCTFFIFLIYAVIFLGDYRPRSNKSPRQVFNQ